MFSALQQRNRTAVLETIKAIDCCVSQADLKLINQARDDFFRNYFIRILTELMIVSCGSDYRFCYKELVSLLYKLFNLVGTGRIRCELFRDVDNVPGLVNTMSQEIVRRFPLITVREMSDILALLLRPRPQEAFDDIMSQFVARSKQTSAIAVLGHLRAQRVREMIANAT